MTIRWHVASSEQGRLASTDNLILDSSADIIFETGTDAPTEALRISNKEVGIGTSAPERLLHVYSSYTAGGADLNTWGQVFSEITYSGTESRTYNQAYRGVAKSTNIGGVDQQYGAYLMANHEGSGLSRINVGAMLNGRLGAFTGTSTYNIGAWCDGFTYSSGEIEYNIGCRGRSYGGSSCSGHILKSIGGWFQSYLRDTSSGLIDDSYGIYVESLHLGGSTTGTVTNAHGAYIEQPTKSSGTLVNSYALKITGTSTASTDKYAIYNDSPHDNYFAGLLALDPSTGPSVALSLALSGDAAEGDEIVNSHAIQWCSSVYADWDDEGGLRAHDIDWTVQVEPTLVASGVAYLQFATSLDGAVSNDMLGIASVPDLKVGVIAIGDENLDSYEWNIYPQSKNSDDHDGDDLKIDAGGRHGSGIHGILKLGTTNASSVEIGRTGMKLGFYGVEGVERQNLSVSPTVEAIATLLGNLGLAVLS